MKRLLVAGAGPIFQLARVWRNGEGSDLHAPEFTMLEWYRPGATLDALMDETEALLRAVLPPVGDLPRASTTDLDRLRAAHRGGGLRPPRRAPTCSARRAMRAALAAQAGARLREGETWEDLFFRLLLERVEPHRPRAADLPDPLAGAAGGARPARSGRPARRARASSCSSAASSWPTPSRN